ncbi:MAG TPA: DUF2975 domain-containing protein [Bacillota bacterium]|nr:DUF2975 domain-containing protein [Bacillota bacterium]
MKKTSGIRKNVAKIKYCSVETLARYLAPAFSVLFYVALALAALLIIIAVIVLIVNVKTEEMLLPPYMQKIFASDGTIQAFSINLGNGVKVTRAAAAVTLSDIKTVIYGFICMSVVTLAALIPVLRFLSKLLVNVGAGKVFEPENARCINYIGLTAIIASVVTGIMSHLFNYMIFRLFVTTVEDVSLSVSVDFYGIIIGVFILLIGYIYGYACALHNVANPTAVVAADGEDTSGGKK